MKHFLIKYRFKAGSEDEWHREIAKFISAIDNDPALKGKISYRCMKAKNDSDYYHFATAADDQAIKTLQQREFFSHYTEKTKLAAGCAVEVVPLEVIAQTGQPA